MTRSISLTLVFPTDPVTATIFACARLREETASRSSPFSVSSTAKTGPNGAKSWRPRFADDGSRGARLESASNMVVAVVRLTLDGDEEIALRQGAAVDRDALDPTAERLARGAA